MRMLNPRKKNGLENQHLWERKLRALLFCGSRGTSAWDAPLDPAPPLLQELPGQHPWDGWEELSLCKGQDRAPHLVSGTHLPRTQPSFPRKNPRAHILPSLCTGSPEINSHRLGKAAFTWPHSTLTAHNSHPYLLLDPFITLEQNRERGNTQEDPNLFWEDKRKWSESKGAAKTHWFAPILKWQQFTLNSCYQTFWKELSVVLGCIKLDNLIFCTPEAFAGSWQGLRVSLRKRSSKPHVNYLKAIN